MISAYSGARIRAAEKPLLAVGRGPELMARASHGLAAAVIRELRIREPGLRELGARFRGVYGSRICLLVGGGNNGGDALYAGAVLARRGAHVTAILTGTRTHPEALAEFRHRGGTVCRLEPGNSEALAVRCLAADVVIDGILGTGASGGLREPAASLIHALSEAFEAREPFGPVRGGPLVVACDLPSGVQADDGTLAGPVLRAELTVTFGAAKSGLLCGSGARAAGRVEVVDIGLGAVPGDADVARLEPADIAGLWPVPGPEDHKYSRGVLGIVAGSRQYPGAALLAVRAALATGVGMVRYLGPEDVARLVVAEAPETVCSQGTVPESRVQAWLVGPGAVGDTEQEQRMDAALRSGLPVVVDAGALETLGPERRLCAHHVLTPHAGELGVLLSRYGANVGRGDIEADPLRWVRRAAGLTGATVLLKGAVTLVAAPSGSVFSQAEATPWMAAAGSGDVLAGILGSLAASLAEKAAPLTEKAAPLAGRGRGPEDRWAIMAAVAAAVHGIAGSTASGGGPIRAMDIARAVPRAVAGILAARDRDELRGPGMI